MSNLEALKRRALPGPFHVVDGQLSSAPHRVQMDAATIEYICAAAEAHRDGDIGYEDEYLADELQQTKDDLEKALDDVRDLEDDRTKLQLKLNEAKDDIKELREEIDRLRATPAQAAS